MKNFLNNCFRYKCLSFTLILGLIHFICVALQGFNLLGLSDTQLLNLIQYSRMLGISLLVYGIANLPIQKDIRPIQENKLLKEFKEIK